MTMGDVPNFHFSAKKMQLDGPATLNLDRLLLLV